MPDHGSGAWWLLAAVLAGFAGMGWLALSMPAHAHQVWTDARAGSARMLRGLGAMAIVVSLLLCLCADHASMAVLVWIMALAASALLVAFVLASRPRWLRWLVPWVWRRMGPRARARGRDGARAARDAGDA